MNFDMWEEISSRAGAVLNYGIVQKEQLQNSRLARFIAAVPFLAGCDKPLETSFSHLITFLVSFDESAKDLYFHKPQDNEDIYSRLAPLLWFSGGDRQILGCCRDLLALCMVSNYIMDAEKDHAVGKYNPVGKGEWDGKAISDRLSESVRTSLTPDISDFYSIEEALKGAWQN